MPFSLDALESAAALVHRTLTPTAQHHWPLLSARLGTETWVKHENHCPTGAFKVRGGLTYFAALSARQPELRRVVCATRGNHGQSVALAGARCGLAVRIVVPHGNSREKNAAMRALGAELIEHGADFQAAREHAAALAERDGAHLMPAFHGDLVRGVASYCLEFLRGAPPLDVVYVPIGLGSGIAAMIAARDALGLATEVVGVVSAHAPAYALSFAQRRAVAHPVSTRIADGMACSTPDPQALEIIWAGAARIVAVSDDEVEAAMRLLFETTHNVAEGAGAAALAAAVQERHLLPGLRVGVVLSGGNVDRALYAGVLAAGEAMAGA